MSRKRIFILSPANAGGRRAQMLLNSRGTFDLARRLQCESAEIGEVFAFVSGLYFRGKLAYLQRFANPPAGLPAGVVITAGRGLLPPEALIDSEQLRQIAGIPIDLCEPRYTEPLERDAHTLNTAAGPECDVVLLGSIATAKYVSPLLGVFGERLLFPAEFVGRGDMSRGGLMLRSAHSGVELTYVAAFAAVRHGQRPSRLERVGAPPQK